MILGILSAEAHLDQTSTTASSLNIAPLWELVLWKEAKDYCKGPPAGKHECSSIRKWLKENISVVENG